jgi:phosphomannomutase
MPGTDAMKKYSINPEIFREYDIRGVVGHDFDEAFAYGLGQAITTYIITKSKSASGVAASPVLTVGYDARLSSPGLAAAMSEGMQSAGAKVITLGLITTPMSYFSTFHLKEVTGGVMITGSHNPPEYNGFKISVGKSTISGAEIQELRKLMEKRQFAEGKGSQVHYDIFEDYIGRYRTEFKDLKPVKVVLDCGNGVAGCVVRRLYEAVGLKPEILFEEPDGKFPNHHPDPTVEKNLTALKAKVIETGSVVGIGFDGDADRIGIVDGKGRFIQGDEMMMLISRAVLKATPGAKIIGDVKCSDRLFEDVKKNGGQPIMWKTGHSLIKAKIKEEKAPFGGELSGHVFFADRNYGYDDALYAGLRVVEILSQTGKTIEQLLEGIPSAFNTPEIRIDTTEDKKRAIVLKLQTVYAKDTADYKINQIDGVRISYKDGWALARASNTQPVLVLRFESTSQAGLKRIQGEIESIVNPML